MFIQKKLFQKKSVWFLFAFVLFSVVAYPAFTLFWIVIAYVFFLALLLLFFVKTIKKAIFVLQKRKTKVHFFTRSVCFLISMVLAGGIAFAVSNLRQPAIWPMQEMSASEELQYLYQSDQADRFGMRLITLEKRDIMRIKRVHELIENGLVTSDADKYYAAAILQHSTNKKDYELSYRLSKEAFDNGYQKANGLWQAAYDRWLISMGEQQKYNTQRTLIFSPFGVQIE